MVWFWRITLALLGLLAVALVAGAAWQTWAEARDDRQHPPPGRFVDVGGRRLHVRCIGAGAGPTVLMLSGGGTPSVASYVLQDRIARFARVCSYDRAGLGWSDPPRTPLDLDGQLADLEALLNRIGESGPLLLVPESFGGLLAVAYAERRPQRVAGIVFVDAAEPAQWFATMPAFATPQADLNAALMTGASRLGLIRLLSPRLAPDWVRRLPDETRGQLRAVFSRPSPGFAEAVHVFRLTPIGERPAAKPFMLEDTPVVAIRHGRPPRGMLAAFELGWPAAQAKLAALSTRGRVLVAEGAGHMIAQEQPDVVAGVVREVLNEARAPAPAA